ncbi:MAG: hypothetical protein ACXVJE_19405 [Mucilaginibacter sp.]
MPRITVPGYNNYFGGKSGSGTYQTLINRIPPHKTFISGCLGLCGVTRHIKPAAYSILNDLDADLIASWKTAIGDQDNYRLLTMDVVELIRSCIAENYDTGDTFLYLDPPYRFVTRKGKRPVYKYEMTDDQHRALLAAVLSLKHTRIMISHYPDEMYDAVLTGWHTFDFWAMTRKGKALERIYYNYDLTGHLHDYSYVGKGFREREKLNRIKKNIMAKLDRLDPVLKNSILSDLASQLNAI